MHEQLQQIVDSFQAAQMTLQRLGDRLKPPDWTRRPSIDGWSAIECVEHLNLTSRAYLPLLRDALVEARDLRAPAPARFRRDMPGVLLSAMIGPMRHIGKFRLFRVKTTKDFIPQVKGSPDGILSEFVRLQGELITFTRNCDALAIDRVKIVSPFGGKMKYNVYSALVILPRHQHRHLEQAEEASK